MTPRDGSPGVRFPPPLIHLGAILTGAALGVPLPQQAPWPPRGGGVLGVLFVVAALLLNISGFMALRRAGTTIRPDRGATALVTGGPYRFSRNPLYISLALMHAGVSIWARSVWALVMLVPALILVDRFVIRREERHLQEVFGGAYRDYRRRTRRWL